MNKYKEALTTTKTKRQFEFKDLIELAEMANIKCENCVLFKKSNLIIDYGNCMKHQPHSTLIIGEYSNHFCKEFEPKEK